MAFLRVEKKKSGTYLRIVSTYRESGRARHKTLYSLGKAEDYSSDQLKAIAEKLLNLAGLKLEDVIGSTFRELRRLNYGYPLIVKKLWETYRLDGFSRRIGNRHRLRFDWAAVLQLMISERMNEPGSKLKNYHCQQNYLGFDRHYELQYFYRTLDLLSREQELLKEHISGQQQNLFSARLDVVFYDVTTLYFDSQKETDGNLRRKGYSKDGKAHKVQIVLGLLVDKLRNPITYHIYQGNTYEGHTMIDALREISKRYNIDKAIVVADSAMIDKDNRAYITDNGMDYILGDRIKSLPEKIKGYLLEKANRKAVSPDIDTAQLSYAEISYRQRRIICTWSSERAKKDAYERNKLIEKARDWLARPDKYKQAKKRGAGRFIISDEEGLPIRLDDEKIVSDERYDGFKAIATSTDLPVREVLDKYGDLYNVEHSFRMLKSQIEIRPVFHWTNRRIEGHIAMCFLAYTFLNHLRNETSLQISQISRAMDKMQMSEIQEGEKEEKIFMRSSVDEQQKIIFNQLKITVPNDVMSQQSVNQLFTTKV